MDLSNFTPDQRKAIQHLDGPLLVCAGAGTGKTFTLTQRISWALVGDEENGIDPFLESIDDALVITYTNKAAAELKSRFRSALRSVGKLDDALKIDTAWISTIHGMCSRILREHALELNIDPDFALAMGTNAEIALMSAINHVIQNESHEAYFQPLFDEFDTSGVRQILDQILKEASCQTRGLDSFNLGPEESNPLPYLCEALEAATHIAENGKGKTQEKAARIADQLTEFLSAETPTKDIMNLIQSLDSSYMRGNGVTEFKDAIGNCIDTTNANNGRRLMMRALDLSREVEAEYQAILRTQGLIDTSDLIRKTLAAFDAFPDIAKQYSKKFKLIMVDEFQDTSQLQIDMIERIAGPNKASLCTVGDSQQSIYRFQGADVGVYLKHKADMKQNSALMVELKDNFRSNTDVLSFVRAVCGRPGFFVEEFLDLQAKSKGRCYKGSSPRIELAMTSYDRGCLDAAISEEAKLIATRFKSLIEQGHKPSEMVILMGAATKMDLYAKALREEGIPCMAAGGSKFYESKHVKQCISLINILANPYDSESMLDVLSSEILPVSSEDLLYLSTYRNPETGLLKRQDFAHALLYEDRKPELASPLLNHAMKTLSIAWRKLGSICPSSLLVETITNAGWFDRLQTQGEEGEAIIADILKIIRLVAEEEKTLNHDMCQIASTMRKMAKSEKESPGVLSVEGLEAVRLMTIHASKGLEFPIVAVTNCFTSKFDSGSFRTSTDQGAVYASLFPKGQKLSFKEELSDDFTLSYSNSLSEHRAKIIETDKARSEAERRRLFYVAITRATDALIIAMHKERSSNLTYKELEADILNAFFLETQEYPIASGSFEYGGTESARYTRIDVFKEKKTDIKSFVEQTTLMDGCNFQDEVETTQPEGFGSSKNAQEKNMLLFPKIEDREITVLQTLKQKDDFFSYSSLSTLSHNINTTSDDKTISPQQEERTSANQKERHENKTDPDKATNFGTAFHRVCQWIAMTRCFDQAKIQDTARRIGREYNLGDIERLELAIIRWMKSDIAQKAYSYHQSNPEVPFAVGVGKNILEGEIDLLCQDESREQACIIDYKTGGSANETREDLQKKHLLQAQCYAFACLTSGYKNVDLHFVRVEQVNQNHPKQPQVISYNYASKDLKTLEEILISKQS